MKTILMCLLLGLALSLNLPAQKTINGIPTGPTKQLTSSPLSSDCDTIFSFPVADEIPAGLAYNGSTLFSTGSIGKIIYKFNENGQVIDTIPSPALDDNSGGDLDFDGTYLWAVVEQDGMIYKMNPSNGNVVKSFHLSYSMTGDPNVYGCAYDNGFIWITEYMDQTLMRINATTGALVDSFAIRRNVLPLKIVKGDLYGLEFVEKTAWGKMQLIKFNKTNGAVIDSIPWCLPYSLGFTWANNYLWGLSSGYGFGTRHIYKFKNLLSSINEDLPFKDEISLFPNPTVDKITIASSKTISKVEIFNGYGAKVLEATLSEDKNQVKIDLSRLQKGIYIVRIISGEDVKSEKLVID